MADKKQEQTDIPCQQTFNSAVDLFLLLAKQQAHEGQVSLDALDFVAQAIQTDPAVREKYCDKQFERCSQQVRQSMQKTPRINVYGRIVSQPFETLLNRDPVVLATPQLTNFFHAIEALLGRAQYETLMETSLRLMERISQEKGNKFTYYDLYVDKECWNIRWDSFMALAGFFSKFNIRKDWYIRVMQSDPHTPGQGVGQYPFSDFQFKQQMMCIFKEFTNLSDDERKVFEKRYSEKQRNDLSKFLANVAAIDDEV
ncbi:hypothetical protein MTBPR1_90031 [Candidatus Terasakiella magnetica]|uniref:Uncharacterized protein n=1 Tax=Candidatus Terasakiella magnetica TaxID=1867952 RepID=A0A1C3RLM5_9PROT|nr:hypothetical protein [Candidatus Terasakiella magnetica]SCA58184.1 hypothetical protein MTBPR1_90031 [Candidatus Terasakiella magnetica]